MDGSAISTPDAAGTSTTGVRPLVLELAGGRSWANRSQLAATDVLGGLRLWRLGVVLGSLDIRLRYRGSVLGPLWLTLSTAVMVASLGFLYSTLFGMDLRTYLPFLALSIVLWGYIGQVVSDGCTAFTSNESTIRSVRLPFALYAVRCVVRNLLILGHTLIVIVAVYALMHSWPGLGAVRALPGIALWVFDSFFVTLLLASFCARFRDIPPIVGSVMQIAFYVTPVIWRPEQLGNKAFLLPLNPFFALLEIVRAPLLGEAIAPMTWTSALASSAILCALSWLLFTRVRNRLAFWV